MDIEKGTPGSFCPFQKRSICLSMQQLHFQFAISMGSVQPRPSHPHEYSKSDFSLYCPVQVAFALRGPRGSCRLWTALVERLGSTRLAVHDQCGGSPLRIYNRFIQRRTQILASKSSPIDNPIFHLLIRPVQVIVDDDLVMHAFLLCKCHLLVCLL